MRIFIETNRLIICQPQLTDVDDMYALQSDATVMQFIGQGVRTKDEVLERLKKAIAHQNKHGFSIGNVYEKESGCFVGAAGLIHPGYDDEHPDIEVAYALIPTVWGKGYGTELARSLIEWGFQYLTVEKIIAIVHPQNNRSRHVLEKLNMQYRGLMTHQDTDVVVYSISKSGL